MKIYLASYQAIMLMRGGPTFKVLHLKNALQKIGIEAELLDYWNIDLKIEKSDLVHIFNAHVGTYHLAQSLKLYGANFVVNPIFYNRHPYLKVKSYLALENFSRKILKGILSEFYITKTICENAEFVLPNTIEEGEMLAKGLGVNRGKIHIIHNGVEERFLHGEPSLFQKKYGLKDFVLHVGHLGASRKNSLSLIKALQKIDVPSVIVGNMLNNTEGKKCLLEIEKSKNIIHIPWITHDDPILASAYAACKTFALPTRFETPGRAALEAGLAGANIVITPFGGTKEYFMDFADYANPYSVKSIKEKIAKSLNKDKNEKLKNHIKENFLWDVIAKKTAEIYRKV